MKREIKTHHGNLLNDALLIRAIESPGPGGACCNYEIRGGGGESRMSSYAAADCNIRFQNGNPTDAINGISNEALLAIVRDRLEGFQAGPFACNANRHALIQIIGAMTILKDRTADRTERGVEGTQQP